MPTPSPSPAPDPDLSAFANDLQSMATQGGFDPFQMISGAPGFHVAFLAPMPPTLTAAVAELVERGTGDLLAVVRQFEGQGRTAEQARDEATAMFSAAQGVLVAVLVHDQGLVTVPQLFFGHLEPDYRAHALTTLGERFPDQPAMAAALERLSGMLSGGARWPTLVAGPGIGADVRATWLDLAARLAAARGGSFAVAAERQADLAWWIAQALGILGVGRDADELGLLASCQVLGGDLAAASHTIVAATARADLDDADLVTLVTDLADGAIRAGTPLLAADWLTVGIPAIEARTGRCFELWQAQVRCLTAAGVPAARLLPACTELMARDRKSARHELTREPIWRVTVADPGDLLDTAEAATITGRSPTFIAKRLEAGTMPSHRKGDEVRLPRTALTAWQAVMAEFKLLE